MKNWAVVFVISSQQTQVKSLTSLTEVIYSRECRLTRLRTTIAWQVAWIEYHSHMNVEQNDNECPHDNLKHVRIHFRIIKTWSRKLPYSFCLYEPLNRNIHNAEKHTLWRTLWSHKLKSKLLRVNVYIGWHETRRYEAIYWPVRHLTGYYCATTRSLFADDGKVHQKTNCPARRVK